MADNKKRLEEMQRLLNEINKVYTSLNERSPFGKDAKNLEDSNDQVKILEDSLKGVKAKMEEINAEASETYDAWASIAAEAKGAQKTLNSSNNILSTSSNLSRQIRDHQQGTNTLSSKQLDSLKSKLESKKQDLKTSQQILNEQKNGLIADNKSQDFNKVSLQQRKKNRDIIGEINKTLQINNLALEKSSGLYDMEIDKASKLHKQEKQIQKDLGITGGILKGISKIPILGDVFDANKAVEEMEKSLRSNESTLKALGKGFKNIGSQIMGGVLNPANMVLGAFTFILSLFKDLDSAAGDYAKSMNVTYGEALKVREEMSDIAASSGDTSLNAKILQKTLTEVGNSLGTNAKLNEADLKIMTKLTNQAGFTADELMDIQKLSLGTGKSLESNTKEILGGAKEYARRNKIAVNEKTILKEVNKMSASLKLSLGGSGDAMAKAAIQAKKFGINLEQAESIASSLLDFESSIENELSAELLLGRNLNLEKARGLALNGDAAGAAAEMLKQVGSIAEYGELNVIQQESLAKAMGMSREELSKSLVESAALKSIGVDSVEKAQEEYDILRKTMSAEEAKKKLGDEALASQFEQQSNAEKFAQTIEHLKEIFTSIVDGPLGTMLNGLSSILESTTAVYGITGALAGLYAGKMLKGVMMLIKAKKSEKALSFGSAVVDIIKGAWSSLGGLPVVGPVLALAAIGAGIGYMSSQSKKVDDGVIDPQGGIVMSGKKGQIQLNKEDSVVAGTNLFGGKKKSPTQQPQSSGTSVNVDMSQTNALLQKLISVISAGGDVVLDGQKVGNALNLVSYKTQ